MRRLLLSLLIALLLTVVFVSPSLAKEENSIATAKCLEKFELIASNTNYITSSYTTLDNGPALPDGLSLSGLTVTPVNVNKGEIVSIKVKATNSSSNAINYALTLTLNGKTAGSKQVSLESGNSQDITFPVVTDTVGVNNVQVGNQSGTFTVKSGSFWDMLPGWLWAVIGVILVVIVVLAILLVAMPSRKKKPGVPGEQSRNQMRPKGKPGKTGKPGTEPQFPMPGPMQQPGMEGMPYGSPFPGQPPSQFDSPQPAGPGMQPPYQARYQPGMPTPGPQNIQQPWQQGMQPPTPSESPQQGPRGPLYPPQPPTLHGMQPPTKPQGMQQGIPNVTGPGAPPQPPYPQPGQPGMQFGMQPPPQPGAPHGMQPPIPPMGQPGFAPSMPMHPPIQPIMPQGIHPAQAPGMQMPGSPAFPSTGMPRFNVSNLNITPNRVKVGEPVTISAIVINNGMQAGKYSIVLRVAGVVENISDINLPAGGNQTINFTVIKDSAADYYADIDGLGGFFTVIPLAPPSFTVSNFAISPERVRQGQPVTISASVSNVGEITGTHTLILRIKGMAESQQEVTLAPGKAQSVEFQIVKDTPGFFPVSLENWTGKFVVEMDWTG